MRYLLDTNIVSALIRAEPDTAVPTRYGVHAHESAIAATVWHELRYGVARLPAGRRRDVLAAYLDEVVGASLPILPYDTLAAAWHARERARQEREGRPRPFADGQIAAIAATRGMTVVTRNVADFDGYEGLAVEDWSAP